MLESVTLAPALTKIAPPRPPAPPPPEATTEAPLPPIAAALLMVRPLTTDVPLAKKSPRKRPPPLSVLLVPLMATRRW